MERHTLIKALLLLLLVGCSSPKEWVYREVHSDCPTFCSTQLIHYPDNDVTGIGVEILDGCFETVVYLYVSCRTIPPFQGDGGSALVVMEVEEERFSLKALRMEGGQRLQLPEEGRDLLITSLLEGKCVILYLEGYSAVVKPTNFKKK